MVGIKPETTRRTKEQVAEMKAIWKDMFDVEAKQSKAVADKKIADSKAATAQVKKDYNELISLIKQINSIELQLKKIDIGTDPNQFNELNKQFDDLQTKFSELFQRSVTQNPFAQELLNLKDFQSAYEEGRGKIAMADAKAADEAVKAANAKASAEERAADQAMAAIVKKTMTDVSEMEKSGAAADKLAERFRRVVGVLQEGVTIPTDGGINKAMDSMRELEKYAGSDMKSLGDRMFNGDTYSRFTATIEQATGGFQTYTLAVDKATGALYELDLGTKSANTALVRFDDQTVSAANALSSMLIATKVVDGLNALKQILTDCVDAAIEFEAGMAGVQRSVGGTSTEINALAEYIKTLALNIPITTTSLNKIAETAGQLGVQKENVAAFTEIMARLGTATDLTAEEAATLLAQFSSITRMNPQNYDRLASTIALLGDATAATGRTIAEMSLRMAGAGSVAGMTEQDILGIAAALGGLGVQTEAGGSAMSRLITELQKAVELGDGLEAFASVANMTAETFTTMWGENAAGALNAFIIGLNDTERNGKSALAILDDLNLTDIRLSRSILALAESGDMLTNTLAQANTAWEENTALGEKAAIMYETTAARMQLFENAVNNLQISVGDALTPVLNSATSGLTDFINSFAEFVDQNQWFVQTIAVLATGLGAMVGTVTAYTIAVTALNAIHKVLVPSVANATKSIVLFNGALTLSPVGAFAIALGAVVAVLGSLAIGLAKVEQRYAEYRQGVLDSAEAAREEARALEQLSEEYIRLRSSSVQDETNRERIREIQSEITNLVGDQANNLNLVNGVLDTEKIKLEAITNEYYKQSQAAIDAAQRLAQSDVNLGVNAPNAIKMPKTLDSGLGQDATKTLEQYAKIYSGTANDILDVLYEWRDAYLEIDDASGKYSNKLKQIIEQITHYESVVETANELDLVKLNNLLNSSDAYDRLSDNQQKFVKSVLDGSTATEASVNNLIQSIQHGGTLSKAIDGLFNLDKTTSTITSYKEKLQTFVADVEATTGIMAGNIIQTFDKMGDIEVRIQALYEVMPETQSLKEAIIDELNVSEIETLLDISLRPEFDFSAFVEGANTADEYVEALRRLIVEYGNVSKASDKDTAMQDSLETLQLVQDGVMKFKYAVSETEQEFLKDTITSQMDAWLSRIKSISDEATRSQLLLAYGNALAWVAEQTETSAEKFENLADELDSIRSAYELGQKAIDEYAESGRLSLDTIMDLIDSGYIQYLINESGEIEINEEAFRRLAIAKMDTMIANQKLELQNMVDQWRTEGTTVEDLAIAWADAALAKAAYNDIGLDLGEYGDSAQIKEMLAGLQLLQDERAKLADTSQPLFRPSGSRSSSSSGSTKDAYKEEADAALAELKYQHDAGLISEEAYLNQLRELNDKYFKDKEKYLDDYRKNELQVQEGLRQAEEDRLNAQLDLARQSGNQDEQISIYKQLQDNLHSLAEEYRQRGFKETDNEILELKNKWAQYYDDIAEIRRQQESQPFANFTRDVGNEQSRLGLDLELTDAKSFEDRAKIINEQIKLQEVTVRRTASEIGFYNQKLRQGADDEDYLREKIAELTTEFQQALIDLDAFNDALIENSRLTYDSSIENYTNELKELEMQLDMTGSENFNDQLDITNKMLEKQDEIISANRDELSRLTQAFNDGKISEEDFRSEADRLHNSWLDGISTAFEYSQAIREIGIAMKELELDTLNTEKDNLMTIVEMTKNMIRQEIANQVDSMNDDIKSIQASKKALDDVRDGINDAAKERDKQDAKRKADLQDQLKLELDILGKRKDAIDDEIDAAKDLADIQKNRLEDELDNYRQILDARLKLLELDKENRKYEQDVAEMQKSIQNTQDRIAELSRNDSRESIAERMRLEEQLADEKLKLDNYLYENDIKRQEDAIESEWDRYNQQKQLELDGIDEGLKAFEEAQQIKMDGIDREMEQAKLRNEANLAAIEAEAQAYDDLVANQLEGLKLTGEEYDRQIENIQARIQEVQASIQNSGELTQAAMRRIDEEGSALYEKLIQYNDIYGDGISMTVTSAWENYLATVDQGNKSTLQHTVDLMRQIFDLTKQIETEQQKMANMSSPYFAGTTGLRNHFESEGYNVGWNDANKQFSINGQWFDSSGFENLDGRLQMTYEQLKELEEQLAKLPKYASGGYISKDQLAIVHQGELVLNPEQVRALFGSAMNLGSFAGSSLNSLQNQIARNQQYAGDSINNLTSNIGGYGDINMEFNGVTSESFMRDLPRVMGSIADNKLTDYTRQRNNVARSKGMTSFAPF